MSRDLTDALSKLFIKLGGKLSDSKENKGPVDYIDDITDIVEPGGGGGDNNILVVHPTMSDQGMVLNKTYSEIDAAATSGKVVFFVAPNGSSDILKKDGDYYQWFGFSVNQNTERTWINGRYYRINSDNIITQSEEYTFTGTTNNT